MLILTRNKTSDAQKASQSSNLTASAILIQCYFESPASNKHPFKPDSSSRIKTNLLAQHRIPLLNQIAINNSDCNALNPCAMLSVQTIKITSIHQLIHNQFRCRTLHIGSSLTFVKFSSEINKSDSLNTARYLLKSCSLCSGGVAEWLNAPVLKTGDG